MILRELNPQTAEHALEARRGNGLPVCLQFEDMQASAISAVQHYATIGDAKVRCGRMHGFANSGAPDHHPTPGDISKRTGIRAGQGTHEIMDAPCLP